MSAQPHPQLDARHPWLGLASFTEETRPYFFGRDGEIGDLTRRVQRQRLTVLFGKSGLGKTSLVGAGVVPRLRTCGYCPVPVRIDYSQGAPEPSRQIRAALLASDAAERLAGAPEETSVWELLHLRGTSPREAGAPLIPVLIFDQFEEIFTLAQSDEAGRTRAARLITDLADLVENRTPAALEARLEEDDALADPLDFTRSDYRVLMVLREDYLAPLEALTKTMPSLAQNRLRLGPMSGTQALEAVEKPGRGLVTQEVAEAIVRFVAGGAAIAHAEVEPSLLSLICRELNDARIAQGRQEISLDLLAGSHATILSGFYERALADQPAAARRIIEDELLTTSGYRESVAEEDLLARLAAAGAPPDTLAVLVNRRLLRIEERLDIRRVELTHDVLCPLVKDSREARKAREAREAAEAQLAAQREREQAARVQLVRARRVALGCTVLALLALAAAVLAFLSLARAQRAEHEARQTRAASDGARIQAEHLLGYLSDDFTRELESEGRLDVVAELARRQIDYFRGLPAALRGPDTIRNGALALVHHARALRSLGDVKSAAAAVDEATRLLTQLKAQADTSEATILALARSDIIRAQVLASEADIKSAGVAARAVALLQKPAEAPGADAAVRAVYAEALLGLGSTQLYVDRKPERAVSTDEHAVTILAGLGARDLTNPDMAALSASASAQLVEALASLGRDDEARRTGEEGIQLAARILERRPGHRAALRAQWSLEETLAQLANTDLDPKDAMRFSQRSEQVLVTLLGLDPGSVLTRANLGIASWETGFSQWRAGALREADSSFRRAVRYRDEAASGGASDLIEAVFLRAEVAGRLLALGDVGAVASLMSEGQPLRDQLRHDASVGAAGPLAADCVEQLWDAQRALASEDLGQAQQALAASRKGLHGVLPQGNPLVTLVRDKCLAFASELDGEAQERLGHPAAAEAAWRAVLAGQTLWADESADDRRALGGYTTRLTMAVAAQGRQPEAATVIAPVVQFLRSQATHNHGDRWLPLELASALYAQALAEPARRPTLLKEAETLVSSLAPPLQSLREVRQWRRRIADAQQRPG